MDQNLSDDYFSESGLNVDIPLRSTNNQGEKANKCNQCEYASSVKSSLNSHLKMHSGEKSPFTRLVEEGTFISNHEGELLNSKNEWHQAKIVRTTTKVIQGGAELLRHGGSGGGGGQPLGGRVGAERTQGQ